MLSEDCYIIVGPNSARQYHLGLVQSVSAGSHVFLRDEMPYDFASGDLVRSASAESELNYLTAASLRGASPIQSGDGAWALTVDAQEAA